jgi:amino acid adenylation domain-containing protein
MKGSASTQDRLVALSKGKAQLVELLLRGGPRELSQITPCERVAQDGKYRLPASWAQRRLWFIEQMGGTDAAYNVPVVIRVRGTLDEMALWQALSDLVQRHEVLRTTIVSVGGEVYQDIALRACLALRTVDLSAANEIQLQAELERHKVAEGRRPFDLGKGPLIRARLLRLRADEHLLLVTMHHIVCDGWSLGVFFRELAQLYDAHRSGRSDPLPSLHIQYADYARWQQQWLSGEALEDQLSYWRTRLARAPLELELPTDRPRPSTQSFRGGTVALALGPELTRDLRSFARQHGITLFMTLYAGWAILLARLSGQEEVVIGTPVANRRRAELEGLIGFFVNSIVLRAAVSGHLQVDEFIAHVKQIALEAYDHQDVPFEKVVEAVQPERSLSRHPVFQVMLTLQNAPRAELSLPGATATMEEVESGAAKFDLALSIEERGDALTGTLSYAADLFDRETIERWVACYEVLLRSMISTQRGEIGSLQLLPPPQRRQVIQIFNSTEADYPADASIHQLFEQQAARTPAATAVVHDGLVIDYAELNRRADQLASYLRSRAVGPDLLVGLCTERSIEMVIGMLGILKAGGAYVPLDPDYPSQRLAHMLQDAQPRVVLTQARLRPRLPASGAEVVALDADWASIAQSEARSWLTSLQSAHDLAYVIYTSGSTGTPKGVMIEHCNVLNLWQGLESLYAATGCRRVALNASLSFDASVQQLVQLLSGRTLFIVPQETRRDPALLLAFLEEQGIESIDCTPSQLKSWIAAGMLAEGRWALRLVLVGGEPIDAPLWSALAQCQRISFHNVYGPTECTVDATAAALCGDSTPPHIGKPMLNRRVYILDRHAQPVPIGVIGEIHIGGAGIGRGYLHRAELTAERFVDDPFRSDPGGRMYKSGDLGRWRASGDIEYLGRNDRQVKVRGFRIELAEIEAQLLRHGHVKAAAVIVREDRPGEKQLVAYVVAEDGSGTGGPEELRAKLRAELPEHMVPSAFVTLQRLPLSPSGKLDHALLPAPQLDAYDSSRYEAPQGDVEEILAGVWQELLSVPRVGRRDNFFELGGHSLLIMQMIERLQHRGLSTRVRTVFENPTLAELAGRLGSGVAKPADVPPNLIPPTCETLTPEMLPLVELDANHLQRIVQSVPGGAANVEDVYPLTPLQEGILFHHLLGNAERDTYVVAVLMSVPSRQRFNEFIAAWQAAVDEYDVLRTAVLWEHLPRPVQVVYRRAVLRIEDLALDTNRDTDVQLREWLESPSQNVDLSRAPLLQFKVASDVRTGRCYVLLQAHHIVSDHVTLELLSAEIAARLAGRAPQLESMPYRNHVAQSLQYASSPDGEAFFRRKLGDVEEPTAPFDLANVRTDGSEVEEARLTLSASLAQRLRACARQLAVSTATLFHAAWSLVVACTSGRDDVVFGTVLLGRLDGGGQTQRSLGLFINTLPVRLQLQGTSAKSLVELMQRELVELLSHEQASLAMAQRCSRVDGGSPLFSSLLNYRHTSTSLKALWSGAGGIDVIAARERSNYPIVLSVDDLGEGFALKAQTDRQIEPQRVAEYLNRALQSLAAALEAAPQTPAVELNVVPLSELRRVTERFNDTAAEFPRDRRVHELFEECVVAAPNAVAVVCELGTLTYAELNRRANQLARWLLARGSEPGDCVPVAMARSGHMLIVQIAILKIGSVYVPIDPELPAERLAFMIRDCKARRILADRPMPAGLSIDPAQWLECTTYSDEVELQPGGNLLLPIGASVAAYVMYTSGSTGAPKGVIVPHRAVNRLVINNGYAHITAADCIAHHSNPSFDASTFEIWGALLNSARVLIVPQAAVLEAAHFADLLRQENVTVLWMSVGLFNQYIDVLGDVFGSLRYLIVGGDRLEPGAIRRVLRDNPPRHLLNGYGPTECTTFSTTCLIDAVEEGATSIAIGRPISNARIHILDRRGRAVPIGVTGEIYIGGDGVALGYLNRPELTAERFVVDPFSGQPESRLYRTGDLGRWLPDGMIEFRGRNDLQVKIRGFRIELGEIEAQLLRHRQLKEAVVIACEDGSNGKRLVAYVVANDLANVPGADELRAHLKAALPEYMLPSAFVALQSMPLTANGKVDRRALPAPEQDAYAGRDYQEPRGEVEELLAGIWQELLRVPRVGRQDNFFELGGHSLLIIQMMERLRRRGLAVQVRRVFECRTLAELAEALSDAPASGFVVPANLIPAGCQSITPQMLPLIALDDEHIEQIVQAVPGGSANIQDIYPLAPLQEGILFHHLLDRDGGDPYVLPTVMMACSRARVDEFVGALQAVVNRQDILRTAVLWEQLPQPVQVVYRHAALSVEEMAFVEDRDPAQQIEEWLNPARLHLDIRRAPMMKVEIAREPGGSQWYVVLKLHHIAVDGVALRAMISEVVEQLDGRGRCLPQPVSYRVHVAQSLAYNRTDDAEAFFRRKLADVVEPTAPFGLIGARADLTRLEKVSVDLDRSLAMRIRARARRLGVSAATMFHAAWALVLAQTSGREDVVFGTVLLGRLQSDVGAEQSIGLFINTLPLRLRLADVPARDFIEQTQRELVELLQHEQASLALAQRCSAVPGVTPLFSSLLNYRHAAARQDKGWSSATGLEVITTRDGTNYPITVSIDDLGDVFRLSAHTDRRVSPPRILGYLQTAVDSLLDALENAPQTPVQTLTALPTAERHQVLELFNATSAPRLRESLVHELFEQQAQRTPQATAVEYGNQRISYAELNCRANGLARELRTRGALVDQAVGICVERSIEMVVGLLAIMKAGAAYLPLDPNYPAERLSYMIDDAAPCIILTQQSLRARLSTSGSELIELDGLCGELYALPAENLSLGEPELTGNSAVYVIYTSGSTGRPKGTVMTHGAMVNLIQWHRTTFVEPYAARTLQFAALSFDVAFQETFSTLCTGGTLVLIDEWLRRDASALLEFLRDTAIERLFTPPLMLQSLAEAAAASSVPPRLRDVITAGEQLRLNSDIVRLFERLPQARLHNHYGPTETHVVTALTLDREPRQWPSLPAIGRPIANARIYILDTKGQPVPLGVVGEIYIGGAGVARGYWKRDEMTSQRFVPDPFSPEPARLYRTGDLGRWSADGQIEYLGRNDDQVKIRGFRIELGEIEAQLALHGAVREVAVVVRQDECGEKRLVAYLTPRASAAFSVEELRDHLRKALPEHMVPSAFVPLPSLPLTPSGKLDRRALPAPHLDAYASREHEPPQGEVEEILAGIWQELLRLERVGRQANFFELGGHSLLVVQMMERLRRIGLTTTIRRVFEHPTLAGLADVLQNETVEQFQAPPNLIPSQCTAITPQMLPLVELEPEHIERIIRCVPGGAANIQDIYPLAPLQQGILFHHIASQHGADAYARPVVLAVPTKQRLDELTAALQALIDRHDVLRTAILWESLPRPVQVVYKRASLSLVEDPEVQPGDLHRRVQEWIDPARQTFDLRYAPLLRLRVAREADSERWCVVYQLHHIVDDGVSSKVMNSEMLGLLRGETAQPTSSALYRDYVAQALAYSKNYDVKSYFAAKLGDVREPTAPFGLMDARREGAGFRQAKENAGGALGRAARTQARRLGVSAATLFHAAWGLVVAHTSGRDDVVFGSVLMGRLHGSGLTLRSLGLFINTLPIRLKMESMTAKELVLHTQRELVELLTHEQAPLAVVQRCSGITGPAPLFTALFNYRPGAVGKEEDWIRAAGMEVVAAGGGTNYPITLSVDDLGEEFALTAQVDARIEPRRIIGYLRTALASLVEALQQCPGVPAVQLCVLPAEERRQVVELFNATATEFPRHKSVHELFEEQVKRRPRAVAVECEGESLSYAELNARANQLARHLREAGLEAGECVPVLMQRSVQMLITQLAVLKCGAAYVPLDPELPLQRKTFMVRDCCARRLLGDTAAPIEALGEALQWIDCGDAAAGSLGTHSTENLAVAVPAGAAAYVMYTSGSTGIPKGAVVPHGAVNRLAINNGYAEILPDDCIAHHSNPAFDASTFEIWAALLNGARVLMIPQHTVLEARAFAEAIRRHQVTMLYMSVGLFNQYARALREVFGQLRYLMVGGDALEPSVIRSVLLDKPPQQLLNVYGPTECTTFSTKHLIEDVAAEASSIPIGVPIANTQVYILDSRREPVAIGVTGEMYIGGAGVALGYLNRPQLNAERFVADPFSVDADARLYRTGDLARWRADGVIEFLGRNDQQVKIRGFRIELGEIEAQLLQHPQVTQAVVVAREQSAGEKQLVAYVVAANAGDDVAAVGVENLREQLRRTLPEYMLPSAYVTIQALPLTPNGKVDRRALPAPELAAYAVRQYEPPRGEVEETLAAIWRAVLHVESVGRHDDFFELGGHSLHAMKVVAAVESSLSVRVAVPQVFKHSMLAQMAELIAARQCIEQEEAAFMLAEMSGRMQGDERLEYEEGTLGVVQFEEPSRGPAGAQIGATERT